MNVVLFVALITSLVAFGAWLRRRSIRAQIGARRAGQQSPK